jgi:DNA-binding transcriptional MerR regulator
MTRATVHAAAAASGWSPRLLRYLERIGLLVAPRTRGGYRLYTPAEIDRLCALRTLVDHHHLALSDLAFAKRLHNDPLLAHTVTAWLDSSSQPQSGDWLRYEQHKLRKLLAAAAA